MKRVLFLAVLAAFTFGSRAAMAFDEVVHYAVVYAVAIANGLSPEDATLVATASYSLDENDATTAYSESLRTQEIRSLRPSTSLSELPHMRSGQVFHALTSEENRRKIEAAHIARIRRVRNDIGEPGTPEQKRQRELLYFGQYLHFVADLVVHPNDPFLGHAAENKLGISPDRADLFPDKMQIAIALLGEKIREFGTRDIRPTPPARLREFPRELHPNREIDFALRRVAGAVMESYARSYQTADDTQRVALASSEISRILRNSNLPNGARAIPKFRPLLLDSDGEPLGGIDSNNRNFGSARRVDLLPFADALANSDELRRERQYAFRVQGVRASAGSVAVVTATLAQGRIDKIDAEVRRAATWLPPLSPGGVALNPRLEIPNSIGTPLRLTLDDRELVLETSIGRYAFEGVTARSFATVARALAIGQIPFVTIGTLPSSRPGYARVTYSPAFEGTAKGAALYYADVQFKGIFANFPFGESYGLNRAGDSLVAGFPGAGGEFTRFWITSSNIKLTEKDGSLMPAKHGMRILSETTLRREVRTDPEIEAYADTLTRRWDQIAERLEPFRAVERLARATAIAFWAREHQVEIDPFVLLLPPQSAITPTYASIVVESTTAAVTGGIALTPEDRRTTLGRQLMSLLTAQMSSWEQMGFAPWMGRLAILGLGVAYIGISVAIPGVFLWLIVRAGLRDSGGRLRYCDSLLMWLVVSLIQIVIVIVLSPLLFDEWLSSFDSEFLALAVTFGIFPLLLSAVLKRGSADFPGIRARLRGVTSGVGDLDAVLRARPAVRLATVFLGLFGPVSASVLGMGLTLFTVGLVGSGPAATLNSAATYQLATLDAVSRALVSLVPSTSAPGAFRIFLVPHSLLKTFQPPYERHHYSTDSDGKDEFHGRSQNPNRHQWPMTRKGNAC